MTMKPSRTVRALLSVTALAWSIPFAQAAEERLDAEESVCVQEVRSRADAVQGVRRRAADDATREPEENHGRP
jgi:antitoxin component of RelBE/YafQ-DinJ toxin-antitoxin module